MQIAGQLEAGPAALWHRRPGVDCAGGDQWLSVAIRTLELAADRLGIMGWAAASSLTSPPGRVARMRPEGGLLADLDPGLQLIETPLRRRGLSRLTGICLPGNSGGVVRFWPSTGAAIGAAFGGCRPRRLAAGAPESRQGGGSR